MNTICLRCGTIQVRSDLLKNSINRYVILDNNEKNICPRCKIDTEYIATNHDIKTLRKKLEENPSNYLDGYILKLIKR